MKRKHLPLVVAAILLFFALLAYGSHRSHFRWDILGQQIGYIYWPNILFGVLLIYAQYPIRALRWAIFLRPTKRVPLFHLVGTQFIGFTAVALLGRVADVTRPYLVARRSKLSVSLQMAIWTVERMFDAVSMAIVFSFALLLTRDRVTMPHPELAIAGAKSAPFGAVALIFFTVSLRLSGDRVAQYIERRFGDKLGLSIASKIRAFHNGLDAVSSTNALLQAAALSLLLWTMISAAYLMTVRAFAVSPTLASMTLGRCALLMAASFVGSVVPIPVVSWFTQILILQQTMQRLLAVPPEAALACGAGLTFVTFLCVIPAGLLYARLEHVSLTKVAQESERLENVERVVIK